MIAMNRTTIKQVNAAIKALGFELLRGEGYYYFAPLTDSAPSLPEQSVGGVRWLYELSVEQWKAELVAKIAASR